jgi:hypothetical protein
VEECTRTADKYLVLAEAIRDPSSFIPSKSDVSLINLASLPLRFGDGRSLLFSAVRDGIHE